MSIYEDKIIAFIDILGWSDLLHSSSKNESLLSSIDSVAEANAELSQFTPQLNKTTNDLYNKFNLPSLAGECDIQCTHFSDTLVFSSSPNVLSTATLVATIIGHVQVLLRAGYYVRGAVTRGQLHHTRSSLYGPALVRAYQIEQKIAIFPRLVVTSDVLDAFQMKEYFKIDAADGLLYLDLLALSKKDDREIILKTILARMSQDTENLGRMQKHNWFIKYLNNFEANLNSCAKA